MPVAWDVLDVSALDVGMATRHGVRVFAALIACKHWMWALDMGVGYGRCHGHFFRSLGAQDTQWGCRRKAA